MEHYIDPETAAHNIASAFCSREIQNLPNSAFIPGDIEHAGSSIKEIWALYSNVYDFVFDAALSSNESSMQEE